MARVERIRVRAVTRLFGATPALRGVDATFERGTITILEGPNGAGKSTLLSIIGTVLSPSSGAVAYDPMGTERESVRPEIGWVAHESQCYRELTGQQNVELAARLHGIDPRAAWARVSARVGAETFGHRRFLTLSRGQRQRISLARALAHDPSVLLLDEPWTGLDTASAARLEEVLIEERERGKLIIVVSHSPGLAERLSAGRLRLEGGRVCKPSTQ